MLTKTSQRELAKLKIWPPRKVWRKALIVMTTVMILALVRRALFFVVVANRRIPAPAPSHSSKKALSHLRCGHRERFSADIPSRPTRFDSVNNNKIISGIKLFYQKNMYLCILDNQCLLVSLLGRYSRSGGNWVNA